MTLFLALVLFFALIIVVSALYWLPVMVPGVVSSTLHVFYPFILATQTAALSHRWASRRLRDFGWGSKTRKRQTAIHITWALWMVVSICIWGWVGGKAPKTIWKWNLQKMRTEVRQTPTVGLSSFKVQQPPFLGSGDSSKDKVHSLLGVFALTNW